VSYEEEDTCVLGLLGALGVFCTTNKRALISLTRYLGLEHAEELLQ
jgi:hypothetical protein